MILLRATILAMVLGIAGSGLTFWFLGESLGNLTRVPIWSLSVGIGLLLINYLFGGIRIYMLARVLKRPLGMWPSTRAYILGLFSSAVTPGGSGQAPAVVLALIRDGLSPAHSMSITVYVWVLDLFYLAWSVPAGLLILSRTTNLFEPLVAWSTAVLASLFFLLGWFLFAYRLLWLRRVLGRLFGLRWLRRWRRPLLRFLARVAVATRAMAGAGPGIQIALHTLTTGLYTATYLIFYVFVVALGGTSPLLPALAAVQLPMVVSFVFPTPGGAGLLELAAASLFTVQTQSSSVGTTLFAWRLVTFYSRFVIGPALGGTVLVRRRKGRG